MVASLERNIRLIWATAFLRGLVIYLPIFALYAQQELLTVFNVTLILSVGAISVIVFEVPSGAFADLFGRRNTMLLAGVVLLAAVAVLAVGGSMAAFIAFAVLNGLAMSLFSGTDTALLYDSLQALGQKERFKRAVAVNHTMWPAGAAIGAFLGGLLAATSLRLPVYATLIPFTLALVLTFFLVEAPYERETHGNILRQMRGALRTVRADRQLLLLSTVGFLLFSFAEVAHQLKPVFFASKGIAVALFGVIFAATFGLSSLGSFLSERVSARIGEKNTLLVCALLPALLLLGATFATGIWAAAIIVLGSVCWGIQWPIMSHRVNERVSSKQRTTVISVGNLANRLGLAIFAPVFGWLVDASSIGTGYRVAAALSLSTVVLLLWLRD